MINTTPSGSLSMRERPGSATSGVRTRVGFIQLRSFLRACRASFSV